MYNVTRCWHELETHTCNLFCGGYRWNRFPLWSYQRNRWFKCFFFSLHLQNTKYKICVPQITPDLLYITKHLFPHQTENFVHFEMLFYQWFFTCICVFIISHSAISNPIYLLSVYLLDKTDKQYCFKSYIWYKLNLNHKTHLACSFHSSDL